MLFSRRTIQRMLDENAAWMPLEKLREQVDALNDPKEPFPLAKIWEVAVLNALSKIVEIQHEPNLSSRPDIVYRLNGETVIADVRAISDRNRHRRNPVEELNDEFERRVFPLIQAGLKGGFCLSVRPDSFRMQQLETPATELHIPPVERFEEVIFTSAFGDFLGALRSSPTEPHTYRVNTSDCNLAFTFSPNSAGWTLDKYRYTQSTKLSFNPVWNALYKKSFQLEKATMPGHRGIILCDGDCDTLRDSSTWDHYGADDIIRGFMRETNSIEFVLTLAPVHKGFRRDLSPANHTVIARLVHRAKELPEWLIPIRDLSARLPQIRNTALNARYETEWRRATKQWSIGSSFRGACRVSENQIRLSARDLLELLAGVLRQDAFESLPFMARSNPFLNKLARGQLITAVRIEKDETEADDDWAVLEFGDPDPAVSRFRVNRVP